MTERFVGVEQARGRLGGLVDDVASGNEVWLTKRGQPLAVLVGREEYDRLRAAATRAERAELASLVATARQRIADAGEDTQAIDEAIASIRQSA